MTVEAKRNAKIEIGASSKSLPRDLAEARRKLRSFERDNARAEARALREQEQAQKKSLREQVNAQKKAAREVAQTKRKAERDELRAARKRHQAITGGARSVGGGLKQGLGIALGLDAAGGIAGMAHEVFDFEKALLRFQIAARQTPEQLSALRKSIGAVSAETGLDRSVILSGARAYVDLAGASAFSTNTMRVMARTAQATGSEIGDIATVMYSMGAAMHIDPSEFESAMSGMINMSKDGSVHFNQFAEEVIALAPKFARFGVTGRAGMIQLAAMFQVMRGGFKDAAETSTAMEGLFRGLQVHADKFERAGVKIYNVAKDGTKTLKPFSEIFKEIGKSKIIKDPTALIKDVGRGEGAAGLQMLIENVKKYNDMVDAGAATTTIGTDLEAVLTSPTGRVEAAWNKVKLAIAAALTPERLEGFANAIESAAEHVDDIVSAVEKLGGALGALYNFGKKVRGLMPGGDGHRDLTYEDQMALNGQRDKLSEAIYGSAGQLTDDEWAKRRASAAQNESTRAGYNKTVDDIFAAERDERTSPESVRAAFEAKYSGNLGAQNAATYYLKQAHVSDPVETAIRQNSQLIEQATAVRQIRDAIVQGFSMVGIKIGSEPLAKAAANRPVRRPGGR